VLLAAKAVGIHLDADDRLIHLLQEDHDRVCGAGGEACQEHLQWRETFAHVSRLQGIVHEHLVVRGSYKNAHAALMNGVD
jgi:hypothetical protein